MSEHFEGTHVFAASAGNGGLPRCFFFFPLFASSMILVMWAIHFFSL